MALFGGITIPGRPDPENVRRLDLLPIPFIRRAQRLGFCIDPEHFHALTSKFSAQAAELEKDIASYLPTDRIADFVDRTSEYEEAHGSWFFNASSAEQIGKLLFDILEVGKHDGTFEKLKKTKGGDRVSSGKKNLELLRMKHPVVAKILQHREVKKLITTYTSKLPKVAKFHPRSVGKHTCPVCELHHDTNQWRAHGKMGTTRAATGRINHTDPNCFSGDTEVLTENGWVRFDCYDGLQRVAQFWPQTKKIEFTQPMNPVSYEATSLVWNYTEDQIDLLTTADHRCLLQNRKTENWYVTPAAEYPEDARQWNSGQYEGRGVPLSNDFLAFIIATQADGSWSHGQSLDFGFKKQRKIKRFDALLKRLGLKFSRREESGRTRYYISKSDNPDFTQAVKLLLGPQRLFSWPLFLGLNKSQATFVMDELMLWDGDSVSKKRYASKHKHNTDIVATLFSLNGRRAVSRPRVNQAGCEFWMADISRNSYSMTTNRVCKKVMWGQLVYCVSVLSTFLVVRRNGKVQITGNCGNIPTRTKNGQEVLAGFIAPPGKRIVARDLSQIELRDLAHLANEPTMIEVYRNGGDIHDRTSRKVFNLPDDVKPDKIKHRMASKRVNFGIQNGTTEHGLYMQLVMDYGANGIEVPDWLTPEWCKWFIAEWLSVYSEAQKFFELNWYRARRYGCSWDLFGRHRPIPEIRSVHSWIRGAGERQAQNLPVTSTSAGQLKIAMGKADLTLTRLLEDNDVWVWPLLTIHDAAMVECDEEYTEEVDMCLKWAMDSVMEDEETGEHLFRVPIESDGDVMQRWEKH